MYFMNVVFSFQIMVRDRQNRLIAIVLASTIANPSAWDRNTSSTRTTLLSSCNSIVLIHSQLQFIQSDMRARTRIATEIRE